MRTIAESKAGAFLRTGNELFEGKETLLIGKQGLEEHSEREERARAPGWGLEEEMVGIWEEREGRRKEDAAMDKVGE